MLQYLHLQHFSIVIFFVMDNTIKHINYKHRCINEPTDILSFPKYFPRTPGEPLELSSNPTLGTLYVSIPYCYNSNYTCWDIKGKVPLDYILTVTILHGMLHLIGYHHYTDHQIYIMKSKKLKILQYLVDNKIINDKCIQLARSIYIYPDTDIDETIDIGPTAVLPLLPIHQYFTTNRDVSSSPYPIHDKSSRISYIKLPFYLKR
uniref:Putative rRNA maturation factor n=1 Tax=Lygus hesperus TaxID=30085 RepID=A0A0A9W9K8_LYGHE